MTTATVDRSAWLAERRSGIGGSDIAGIVGISPWQSPWSIWVDKVGLRPLELDDDRTPSMRLGHDLEPIIGAWFTRQTGLIVAGEQTLVRHRRMPHHFATVDGFVFESLTDEDMPDDGATFDAALGVFEAKYTAERWDAVPEHYVAQAQWQLHCTGLQIVWIAALQFPFGRPRFDIFEIQRDALRQVELVDAAERFWNDYVLPGACSPPPPDDHPRTAAVVSELWGGVRTTPIGDVSFDDLKTELAELRNLKRDIAAKSALCKTRETTLKARFLRAADLKDLDREAVSEGFVDGELAVSWRHHNVTRLDTKAVRAEHGDRYDCTKSEPRLLLHGRYQA